MHRKGLFYDFYTSCLERWGKKAQRRFLEYLRWTLSYPGENFAASKCCAEKIRSLKHYCISLDNLKNMADFIFYLSKELTVYTHSVNQRESLI